MLILLYAENLRFKHDFRYVCGWCIVYRSLSFWRLCVHSAVCQTYAKESRQFLRCRAGLYAVSEVVENLAVCGFAQNFSGRRLRCRVAWLCCFYDLLDLAVCGFECAVPGFVVDRFWIALDDFYSAHPTIAAKSYHIAGFYVFPAVSVTA